MFVDEGGECGSEESKVRVKCGWSGRGVKIRGKNVRREGCSVNGFEGTNCFGDARRS